MVHSDAISNDVLEVGIAERILKAMKLNGSFWRYLNDGLEVGTTEKILEASMLYGASTTDPVCCPYCVYKHEFLLIQV